MFLAYDTVLKFNAKLMSTHSINKSMQELEKLQCNETQQFSSHR